ncbi:inactive hydroxysteroid dehydrogenase-like protein 1 [Aplochiton taeniatus]
MAAVDSFPLLYKEIARSCNSYVETLALVGALYTASKGIILLRDCCTLVRVHFFPRMIPTKRLIHRFGEWAVIYGASEAIARAYAEELARHGVNIILISRDSFRIQDTATSLSRSYGVDALPVAADFTRGHAAASKPIRDALRGKDVGFLVNCVEAALVQPQYLTDLSEESLWEVVHGNIGAVTLMARLVLPGMVERRRGAVVNISSGVGCRPWPGRAALTASAAYIDNFSLSLHHEYGCQGIFVQSLVPMMVETQERPASAVARWLVPEPEVYARHAISTLGVSHRTTGYWPHTLQYGLMQCIPQWVWLLGSRVMRASPPLVTD